MIFCCLLLASDFRNNTIETVTQTHNNNNEHCSILESVICICRLSNYNFYILSLLLLSKSSFSCSGVVKHSFIQNHHYYYYYYYVFSGHIHTVYASTLQIILTALEQSCSSLPLPSHLATPASYLCQVFHINRYI